MTAPVRAPVGPPSSHLVVRDPAAVRAVFRRVDDFLPSNALTAVTPLSPAALRILSAARFALPPVLASATGDTHARTRKVVGAFFTPAKVAAVGPLVVALTRARLDDVRTALAAGPVDLAQELAQHVPPAVLQELTGIACPDVRQLKAWSRDALELFWGWPDPERQLVLAASAADLYRWLRVEVEASRGRDDLFGALLAGGLSVELACSLAYFLVIAGQETTSQLISVALHAGLADPSGWAALGDGAGRHVRHVLATTSSVPTWRRVAAHDTVLAGQPVPAGAEVLLELSGQHDPDAAPTAYGLAFGHGLHRCLGARLAELETTLVVEETARALPGLVPVGEPEWLRLLCFQTPRTVLARLP
jgi:cytochrome P450